MYKLLIADDEMKIRQTLCDYMSAKGFDVKTASNGAIAVEIAAQADVDLIILDVMMPVLDGIEACKRIREFTDVPVIFLSALGEEKNLLDGYRSGADDYIIKPFPLCVLYEKCLAVIKRYYNANSENKLSCGELTLDIAKRTVYSGEKEIHLAQKDFSLLLYLMKNKGLVLNREKILIKIWGYDFEGDVRVVDTHIKRIRKALGESKNHIETVIGTGYRFKEETDGEKA